MDADKNGFGIEKVELDIPIVLHENVYADGSDHVMRSHLMILTATLTDHANDTLLRDCVGVEQVLRFDLMARLDLVGLVMQSLYCTSLGLLKSNPPIQYTNFLVKGKFFMKSVFRACSSPPGTVL